MMGVTVAVESRNIENRQRRVWPGVGAQQWPGRYRRLSAKAGRLWAFFCRPYTMRTASEELTYRLGLTRHARGYKNLPLFELSSWPNMETATNASDYELLAHNPSM